GGQRLWGTYLGGIADEYWAGLVCDNIGNIYLSGRTTSTAGIATASAHQPVFGGGYDGCLIKFDPLGQRLWGTYFGGVQDDVITKIAFDGQSGIIVSGETENTIGIATATAHQPVYGGGSGDAFIAKFNLSGTLQWSTYYGGNG